MRRFIRLTDSIVVPRNVLKETITMHFESNEQLAAYLCENPGPKVLEFNNCPGLTSLPAPPSTLTNLRVYNCLELKSLPVLPSVLTSLEVDNCPGLKSLPANDSGVGCFAVSSVSTFGESSHDSFSGIRFGRWIACIRLGYPWLLQRA